MHLKSKTHEKCVAAVGCMKTTATVTGQILFTGYGRGGRWHCPTEFFCPEKKKTFVQLHISINNIISYSSNITNVMFGQNNSVSQLLKLEVPFVQLVKYSCHLILLVSSCAALKLLRVRTFM